MLAIRHANDPAPALSDVPGLVVHRVTDAAAIAAIQSRAIDEMLDRFAKGHRVYVAYIDGEPAAFGWVATRMASIGELGASFGIARGERYLWNFVTLPAHRGRGVYPRLIESIVNSESGDAHRFWIAYAPENHASGAGIRKAGFTTVAELSFDARGRVAVTDRAAGGSALASAVLGVPRASTPLSRCWRCARRAAQAASLPIVMDCAQGACACDYQRPEVACAA